MDSKSFGQDSVEVGEFGNGFEGDGAWVAEGIADLALSAVVGTGTGHEAVEDGGHPSCGCAGACAYDRGGVEDGFSAVHVFHVSGYCALRRLGVVVILIHGKRFLEFAGDGLEVADGCVEGSIWEKVFAPFGQAVELEGLKPEYQSACVSSKNASYATAETQKHTGLGHESSTSRCPANLHRLLWTEHRVDYHREHPKSRP